MKPVGLFIGRAVLDLISLVDRFPLPDMKVTAREQIAVGGGPALNAAITFAHLGGRAILCSSFGDGTLGRLARTECEGYGVRVMDRASGLNHPFPISNVVSVAKAGTRCVINAPHQAARLPIPPFEALKERPDIVLLDQFEKEIVQDWQEDLKLSKAPIVLDGGGWKDVSQFFLDISNIPIVSSRFLENTCDDAEIRTKLAGDRNKRWAVTKGDQGLVYGDEHGTAFIAPITVDAVDTLGAGDIFHGAFCFAFASKMNFKDALHFANAIAAESCRHLGTRAWMSTKIGPWIKS